MNIGIDLDEVVVDFINPFIDYFNKRFGTTFEVEDMHSYNLWECGMGGNREEAIRFVREFYESDNFEKIPFWSGARETINYLRRNHKIYIITSRPEEFREKTDRFLAENFSGNGFSVLYSGDFHRQGRTKAEICRDYGIDVHLDDNLKYALECAREVRKVFLFDKPWNQQPVNGNIVRVKTWEEVLSELR